MGRPSGKLKILSDNSSDEARLNNKALYSRLQDSSGTILHNSSKQILLQQLRKTTHYGTYYTHVSTTDTTGSAQNGTTSATLWLINESLTKFCRIKRFEIKSTANGTGGEAGANTIAVRKFWSKGIPSGTTVGVAKRSSTDNTNEVIPRSASTGMTITLLEHFFTHIESLIITVTGIAALDTTIWNSNNDQDCIILPPVTQNFYYGLVFYNSTGSTNGRRLLNINIVWEEYI